MRRILIVLMICMLLAPNTTVRAEEELSETIKSVYKALVILLPRFNWTMMGLNITDTLNVANMTVINSTVLNSTFWRLDGTNAPPTANWNMGNFSFWNVSGITGTEATSQGISLTQYCKHIECLYDGGSAPACTCVQVNESDNIYANGTTGLKATNSGGMAQVHTWHNDTDIPDGSTITTVSLIVEWHLDSVSGFNSCTIEAYNGTWENLTGISCPGTTDQTDTINITSVIHNETLAEEAQIRINVTRALGTVFVFVDHVYIKVTYLPPSGYDYWNLTNASSGAVVVSGQNYTRADAVNATAHWAADGLWNATLAHNGNGSYVNYTLDNSSSFPGNWTNYTLDFSNVTEFPMAGNISIQAIYATDIYGQPNATQGELYMHLYGHADAAGLNFSDAVILNGSNSTLFCNITDANSSVGIASYNVTFWKNESLLGYNTTNSSGIAVYLYVDSTNITNDTTETIPFKCNITAAEFYNASVAEQTANLSIVDVVSLNLTAEHTLYNRGENITLILRDTSNNSIANVSWTVNLTKYNESTQAIFTGDNDSVTFMLNSSDPIGNYSLFANITKAGRELNKTWEFNVTATLKPYFVWPPTTYRPAPGTEFTPEAKVNFSREEELTYLVNLTLTCPNGNITLVNTTEGVYENTTELCSAPSTYSTYFAITLNATDVHNNTGEKSITLQTRSESSDGGNGGGSTRGTVPPPVCNCTEWGPPAGVSLRASCGLGETSGNESVTCSPSERFETRVCTPSGCEAEARCVSDAALCLAEEDFNFTLSRDHVTVKQGEGEGITLSVENTGTLVLNLTFTIGHEACEACEVTVPPQFHTFELLESEFRQIPLSVHVPLTLAPGGYVITINLSSELLEKTRTLDVTVTPNELIPQIAQLESQLSSLQDQIFELQLTGVDVMQLTTILANAWLSLNASRQAVASDNALKLEQLISEIEASVATMHAQLIAKEIERFFAENKWYLLSGAIIIFFATYLISQVLVPYYRLGTQIRKLSKEEKTLVKTRIETEKQYFKREIDEKSFMTILMEGQGKILRVRSQINTKKELRATLMKRRLTPQALFRWVTGRARKEKPGKTKEKTKKETSKPEKKHRREQKKRRSAAKYTSTRSQHQEKSVYKFSLTRKQGVLGRLRK